MWFFCLFDLQYVGAFIPINKFIKNSDKFIAGAGAGVTAVSIHNMIEEQKSVAQLRN